MFSSSFQSRVANLNRPTVRNAVAAYRAKHTKQDGEMKKGMLEFVCSSPKKRQEIYKVESQNLENLHEELENTKVSVS